MADAHIVISGSVMATAIGLSAAETSANVRAHTARASGVTFVNRHHSIYTMASLPDEALPLLPENLPARARRTARERRMLRLFALVRDGLLKFPSGKQPPLHLSLPEHATQIPLSGDAFLDDLAQVCPSTFNRSTSQANWRGRAGGLLAIGAAVNAVAQGQVELALAGGVDSFLDTWVLSSLDKQRRIKTENAPDSFIPGEGIGLVYVSRLNPTAAPPALAPLARVSSVCEGLELGHWQSKEPYLGEGLSGALEKLLAATAPCEPFTEVYSTMNGESYWGKEWGVARLRAQAAFAPQAVLHHPAEFYGDLGAASGPILTGLASLGLQKKTGGPILVYASSDFGARAVLALSTSKT